MAHTTKHKEVAKFRERLVSRYGFDPMDQAEWYLKFYRLVGNASKRELKCHLNFTQYLRLAKAAKLVSPTQIGTRLDQYQMGRKGDTGDYYWGNCRFITRSQNDAEKVSLGVTLLASMKQVEFYKKNPKKLKIVVDKASKNFKVRSPEGKTYTGRNLKAFCLKHGISQGTMSSMCLGKRDHYKGWTGHYE